MGFRTGIVGLPNVGKSTLFNALTRTASAQAANYPFCTIQPNSGEVAVPDRRLETVAKIAGSRHMVPARMTFVDIAGLVVGASQGQGLGNRFLASIREVDAIAHLVRCFVDDDVTHVVGKVDPIEDITTVETELILADIEAIGRRRERLSRKIKSGDPESIAADELLQRALKVLEFGNPASAAQINDSESERWRQIGLLTAKPVLYISNVDEEAAASGNTYSSRVAEYAKCQGGRHVICSAAIEEQLAALGEEEAAEFLETMGCAESGLQRVIASGYDLLALQTFFSAGPREATAWTIPKGATAIEAAGRIHSDFRRGFIRAETASYDDFVTFGGEAGAREAGRLRSEGKSYRVADGDVLHILFNV